LLALKLDEKGYKYDKDLKRFLDTMAVETENNSSDAEN